MLCACGKNDIGEPASLSHIFPAKQAELLEGQCSRPSPGPIDGAWEPSESMVIEIVDDLKSLLQEEIDKYNIAFEPHNRATDAAASDYSFQIFGLVIEGEKIIYVNGMHTQLLGLSRNGDISEYFSVCDGGSGFFGVEYLISDEKFRNFHFNFTV